MADQSRDRHLGKAEIFGDARETVAQDVGSDIGYAIVSQGAVSSYESAGNTDLTMSQQKPNGLLSLGRWTAKA
ncbi:hypothetical protein [Bradyrhizobium canariense]|uniref:hypothetical protein n=1 Tax=Bradyrhizobium canariense TaxID=255045 RepID=UPI00142FB6A3|nr:hypothetical protein [Bradyrhizobium canariense]